jgi:hypothetical protein
VRSIADISDVYSANIFGVEVNVEDVFDIHIIWSRAGPIPLCSSGHSSWLHNGDVLCFL